MLRQLRKKRGFTRVFVADRLKINPKYLNEIERGQGAMTIQRAKLLGELYNTDHKKILKMWKESNHERIITKRLANKKKDV